ncbi:MAG: hypothetical protein L0Y75_07780 [Acidobacteria bacterium]|nr:hypothetical protein [Acidobacteriota bacterium]
MNRIENFSVQLVFEQTCGNRGAIEFDQRVLATGAQADERAIFRTL